MGLGEEKISKIEEMADVCPNACTVQLFLEEVVAVCPIEMYAFHHFPLIGSIWKA